ncbi:hypothetical protein ACQKGI_02675 [Peribacillus muralis]|uniref:hypothetical protein n=1 Tax=Bacillaceae TaxID=186817 RepID=UPI0012FE1008|nr:hypothetical protein [Bacillus sp. mrc49]
MKQQIQKEKFKDILCYAYKLGNESDDMKLDVLIEEIKRQFVISKGKYTILEVKR